MKIYNKKLFASGMFMTALGGLNLAADITAGRIDAKGIVLIVLLCLFGISAIAHSLSKQRARKAKIEELDERNQLIAWKSRSKAFSLTQGISFLGTLLALIMGKVTGYDGLTGIGVGLALAFTVSIVAEFFTFLYCESKN